MMYAHVSNFVMNADDLKIYSRIDSDEDRVLFQEDLDRFYIWCENNKMSLNIQKCKYIRFSRSLNPTSSIYQFKNNIIESVSVIRDLGVLIDTKLSFAQHIEYCRNKALKVLGFIKRNTKDFTDIFTIKLLYTSLTRPHLEFCTSLWSPYYFVYIDMLNSVQRKFLRYAAYKMHIPLVDINYSRLEKQLGLKSVEKRRDMCDIIFAYKIINGLITCPEILEKIQIYVPPRALRETKTFELRHHRTLYGQNSPINRIMYNANKYKGDLFFVTLISLKYYLKKYF